MKWSGAIAAILFSHLIFSQPVALKGRSDKMYWGKTITAFIYDDYISKTPDELAKTTIDNSGNFELKFDLKETRYVFLQAENYRTGLYCEPGSAYRIGLMRKDSTAIETMTGTITIDLTFFDADSLELNALAAKYESEKQNFVDNNYDLFYKRSGKLAGKIDSFCSRKQKDYSRFFKNTYFKNFLTYSLASLKEKNILKKRDTLYNEFIKGKPILFTHNEYMNFLLDFFDPNLKNAQKTIEFANTINVKSTFSSMMNLFRIDKMFENDTIREMMVLRALAGNFKVSDIKSANVLAMLGQAVKECRSDETRKIAQNLLVKLGKLREGTKAPDFELYDMKGRKVKLSDLAGKHVYLDFWATWCRPCLEEMKMIPPLKKLYGYKISFVSISIDRDTAALHQFLQKNPKYDWTILHYGNQPGVKNDYDVLTIPAYFLINPDGTLRDAPALPPGADLEQEFLVITGKKPNKRIKPE